MIRFIAIFIAGLLAGAGGLYVANQSIWAAGDNAKSERQMEKPDALVPVQRSVLLRWQMASNFPGRLTQYGTLGRRFTENVRQISDGTMMIEFAEPGARVPPEQCLDALRDGRVQACWSSPSHWIGRESALALFGGAPFGPSTREYAAWYYFGGGARLMDEIYARMGVRSIPCGVASPEAGGWYKEEIESPADLKGMKVRIFGFGARVMGKLGVTTLRIQGEAVVEALRSGEIDGAEYSMPAVDAAMGFDNVAPYYYFPGWHQQTTILEFVVARDSWENLPVVNRAMIEIACGDNVRYGLAEGEALQARALRELRARGVEFRRWPPEVLAAFRKAWREVVKEEREANPTFKRVWDAYAEFRSVYAAWHRFGYLDPAEASGTEGGSD